MSHHPEADLHALLKLLFTSEELFRFLQTDAGFPDVCDALPPWSTTSKDEFAAGVVEAFARRGHIDASLAKKLVDREQRRLAAARQFSELLGVSDDANNYANLLSSSGPDSVLDTLVLRFLEGHSRWGFNAQRIVRWGSRQPGFGELGQHNRWEVFRALERLVRTGAVRTFVSRAGSTLYKPQSR